MKKVQLMFDSWWNIINLGPKNLGEYLSSSSPFMKKRKSFLSLSKDSSSCMKKKSRSKRNCWNQIPKDILEEIALKLRPLDVVGMGKVCQKWKSIVESNDTRRPSKELDVPWLLLPQEPDSDQIAFYGFSSGRIYKIDLPKELQGGRCCGVSKGWLVMITGSHYIPFVPSIPHLWDPISGEAIRLPPLETLPNFRLLLVEKFSYGAQNIFRRIEVIPASSDQLIVAAIIGNGFPWKFYFGFQLNQSLAFCRPQDKKWIVMKGFGDTYFFDILFHNGVLYVLKNGPTKDGLFLLNLGDSELRVVFINVEWGINLPRQIVYHRGFRIIRRCLKISYLAESTRGELLLVSRIMDWFEQHPLPFFTYPLRYYKTIEFEVHVINFEPGKYSPTFTKLRSLEDQALFVSSTGSLSHGSAGIDKNCVNFLVDQTHIFHGGIISRESGIFHFSGNKVKRCLPRMSAPIQSIIGWFIPKLP